MKELGPDVPLHFTAFHPDYKMTDIAATPAATLRRARDIALAEGLHYVYTGNVHDAEGGTTYCPALQGAADRARLVPHRRLPRHARREMPRLRRARSPAATKPSKRAFGPKRIPVAIHRPV